MKRIICCALVILAGFSFPSLTFAGRYYDCRVARWVTLDPALREGTPQEQIKKYGFRLYESTPYGYSLNNPLLYKDPDGKFPWPIFFAAAYIATQFSGDHPGGSPGLVQSTLVLGSIGAAQPVAMWALRNPVTATVALADALSPPGANVSPMGAGSQLLSNEVKGMSQSSKIIEGLMEGVEKFSASQLKAFEKQAAKDGLESLSKSRLSFADKLAGHVKDLQEYEKAGGYTSKTKTEIRNFQQQINAIDEILGRQKQ